jgi:hypothetical protein
MQDETTRPVQTFRDGAVGVSVWKRNGHQGEFYEFTLSRSYKKTEEEAGYAQTFREYNEEALMKVIGQATAFIRSIDQDAQKEKNEAA